MGQRVKVGDAELLQIRDMQVFFYLADMPQCIGSLIVILGCIGLCTDTQRIDDDRKYALVFHDQSSSLANG